MLPPHLKRLITFSIFQNIFDYYKENASLKIATNLAEDIVRQTLKLSDQPEIGAKELSLNKREQELYEGRLSRTVL